MDTVSRHIKRQEKEYDSLILNPLYTAIAIARECIMDRTYPDWKLWVIVSVYAGGCYVVGTVFFQQKIEDIVAKM